MRFNFPQSLTSFLAHALDFILPRTCLGCKKEGSHLCEKCLSPLLCPPLRKSSLGVPHCRLYYIFDYNETTLISKIIKRYKYSYSTDLSDSLARIISTSITHDIPHDAILVPTPSSKERIKERGFDHISLILSKLPTSYRHVRLLKKIQDTPHQARLNGNERRLSQIDAYETNPHAIERNAPIFVFDDVCTTGSTLSAMILKLQESGYSNVNALVIARKSL